MTHKNHARIAINIATFISVYGGPDTQEGEAIANLARYLCQYFGEDNKAFKSETFLKEAGVTQGRR